MVFSTVDATWVNAVSGAPSYTDVELRRADAGLFAGAGDTADPLRVRGGIVLHASNSLAVTVNASDVVTVQPGAAVIPGNDTNSGGAYRTAQSAAETDTLAARDATNSRIDLVVFEMISDGTQARVRIIAGAPSGSPVVPTLPTRAIELARITVPASGGGTASVDSTKRVFATAPGGTMLVATSTALPTTAATWQVARALDTGGEYTWDGTTWLSGAWTAWTPVWKDTNGNILSIGNGTLTGAYRVEGRTVHFRIVLTRGSTSSLGTVAYVFVLPVAPIAYTGLVSPALVIDASPFAAIPHMAHGVGGSDIVVVASNGRRIDGSGFDTTGTDWAASDRLEITGTYEKAA